jgi:hypothetical protein
VSGLKSLCDLQWLETAYGSFGNKKGRLSMGLRFVAVGQDKSLWLFCQPPSDIGLV